MGLVQGPAPRMELMLGPRPLGSEARVLSSAPATPSGGPLLPGILQSMNYYSTMVRGRHELRLLVGWGRGEWPLSRYSRVGGGVPDSSGAEEHLTFLEILKISGPECGQALPPSRISGRHRLSSPSPPPSLPFPHPVGPRLPRAW